MTKAHLQNEGELKKQSWVMNFIMYSTVLSLMLKDFKFLPANICKVKNVMSFSELMNSKDRFILIIKCK